MSTGSAGVISVAGYYFGIPIEARYPEDKPPADNRLEITVTCKTRGSDNFAEQKAEWQGVLPTDNNVAIYRAICFGQLGDAVEITPVIKRETDPVGFLLSPRAQIMKISLSTVEPPSGCHLPSPPIMATPGLFITGRVTPAISGVVIHASEPSGFTRTVTTDALGAYALGPLYKGSDYTVDASLDGYFVTRSATDKYSFHVLRLASLDVKVLKS